MAEVVVGGEAEVVDGIREVWEDALADLAYLGRKELVAATQGAFVFSRSATLTRALGGVAETFSDESLGETTHGPALWARFERWLDEVATEDIGGLETIIYQAQEREFHRVEEAARAAERAARERPAKPRPTRDIFAFFGGPKKNG